ncbi:MAG: PIN domain-containing protein [Anaerolineae bacterium]
MARFLDTNVILRYLTRDDEGKAEAALNLLQRVERGEERLATSVVVIFEVVYTLASFYGVGRERIRELLLPIINLRALRLPGKRLFRQALDLYCEKRISFADAYNAALMLADGETEIYSYDTDFDRIGGITRLEP